MNIDQFKSMLISSFAKQGLQWQEVDGYEGDGCLLMTGFQMPRYEDECRIRLIATEEYVLLNFVLERIVPSYDNLKLLNDFNSHVSLMNASIVRVGEERIPVLYLQSNLTIVESEQGAVAFVAKMLSYIFSDEVAQYLRPLTIITE